MGNAAPSQEPLQLLQATGTGMGTGMAFPAWGKWAQPEVYTQSTFAAARSLHTARSSVMRCVCVFRSEGASIPHRLCGVGRLNLALLPSPHPRHQPPPTLPHCFYCCSSLCISIPALALQSAAVHARRQRENYHEVLQRAPARHAHCGGAVPVRMRQWARCANTGWSKGDGAGAHFTGKHQLLMDCIATLETVTSAQRSLVNINYSSTHKP